MSLLQLSLIALQVVLAGFTFASVLVVKRLVKAQSEDVDASRRVALQVVDRLSAPLTELFDRFAARLERTAREDNSLSRRESGDHALAARTELATNVESLRAQMAAESSGSRREAAAFHTAIAQGLKTELTGFTAQFEQRSEILRQSVERHLGQLTVDNGVRLEEMRKTVAEKLEGTLERRLGASFQMVSERLEQVHKGLGEMQSLAIGVGDLKKVMTNVKTRGTWGEIQLGQLLEQVLAPEQFGRNVQTKPDSTGRVEFAIKMPNRDIACGHVWLPIDAKFPVETYLRLVEAQDQAEPLIVEQESRQLESFVKVAAREISDKYLAPPGTTDFAVMYLPTEGLFAEVARRNGLIEHIQRECRVIVAGPTTLAALLNSLQMGFRTLAIQKRSSEVWEVLGAVKNEFGKFQDILGKVEKKLQEAGNVIGSAQTRSRAITRKLKNVEEMPSGDAARLLDLAAAVDPDLGEPAARAGAAAASEATDS